MSLLETVVPRAATGKVAEVYGQIEQAFGRVPNAMQLYSSSPALLEQQWQQIGYYMRHPRLSGALFAAIRMLVSQENDCEYCIGFNAGLLINVFGFTPEQVAATKQDPASAPLPDKERALLRLVLKTVNDRQPATREEVDALTRLGWTHGDILDAVAQGARNLAVDVLFTAFRIENDF